VAKSLHDLIAAQFGVLTDTVTNIVTATVGTTAEIIARNDPRRVGLYIQNLSTGVMWVGPFPDPSATKGIRLFANGGAVQLLADEDLMLVGYEFYGVAQVAGQQIYVQETLIVADLPA
jgi:hypothetical protein